MRYCPYCGASILDDAAFCMECGASIPVSGIPKDEPSNERRKPRKKRKSLNRYPASRTWRLPICQMRAMMDTMTIRLRWMRALLRKSWIKLIKQIILVGASAATIVALAIVLMKLL